MRKKNTRVEIEHVETDPLLGLSTEQVNHRIETGNVNISDNPTNKSYLQIVITNVFTFFNG